MKKLTKIILGFLVLAVLFIWTNLAKSPADQLDNNAHLYILNVGQGDAELIQYGDYQILIDGGPDDSVLTELGKKMPPSDRKIEKVILTHPHADHLAGINQILERYEVETLYYFGIDYDSNGYKEFRAKVVEKKIRVKKPTIGEEEMPFKDSSLTFIWPGDRFENKIETNLNNTSLVARFCYFAACSMLMGDLETDAQKEMFDMAESNKISIQADFLKIAHHGSTNGTNELTIDRIKPKMAAISAGAENKYGHPHAAVLDILQKNNVKTYRTDHDGTLEFVFTGQGIFKK